MFFKKSNQSIDYIVAGLGNPGSKYNNTRHNIGFETLDYIADKNNVSVTKAKFSALYGVWETDGRKVMLLKPQTFMNLSGEAVMQAAKFYKVPAENIIVIFDDVSLDVGKMRIRAKGSAGGHNGIKSIISHMGQEFPRIKMGVGQKPHPDYDLADWVLGKFTESDRKLLADRFEDAHRAVKLMVSGDSQKAMNLYNR
ncbi:MAG: aminoacyl-tRNA hydrolase [Oscillospiraceae bacterium]|nr:aminoacyl-tRNA hydrolase [Oscillospiraceae bacterium]